MVACLKQTWEIVLVQKTTRILRSLFTLLSLMTSKLTWRNNVNNFLETKVEKLSRMVYIYSAITEKTIGNY